jgi:hypothetical protein
MRIAVTLASAFATIGLAGCGDNYTHSDRAKLCPPLLFSEKGQLVKVKLSGHKAMVVEPQRWSERIPGHARDEDALCQRTGSVEARLNLHGIALDQGAFWDSVKPEVLPIIKFQTFELEPWTEE